VKNFLLALLAFLAPLSFPSAALAQELYQYQPIAPRWISPENKSGRPGAGGVENSGAKGHPYETLKAGATLMLADIQGAGIVRRIWITVNERSPEMLRSVRLEMFWDGATTPAVSAPLGDFFGAGLGALVPFENAFFSSPEGRSFNTSIPMPFRRSARILLINDASKDVNLVFYDVDYTLGDPPPDAMYFHAYWHRERATTVGRDFRVLPRIAGRGRYLGATLGVVTAPAYGETWWGEGEMKVFLDGDAAHATLVGTGTEDAVGSGWGLGVYAHRYQGALLADAKTRRWVFYRLHVPDPIFFQSGCEVALQQIGGAEMKTVLAMQQAGVALKPVTIDAGDREHFYQLLETDGPPTAASTAPDTAWMNFYRSDDVSAVAYFYLDSPESGLPPIAPVAERLP
jgi:hypothetical protein